MMRGSRAVSRRFGPTGWPLPPVSASGSWARLEREEVAGHFADLDPNGALIMQLDSGQQRRIAAGDIFFPNL